MKYHDLAGLFWKASDRRRRRLAAHYEAGCQDEGLRKLAVEAEKLASRLFKLAAPTFTKLSTRVEWSDPRMRSWK